MKLIKINQDHYVIVDNSEIKEGDWVLYKNSYIATVLGFPTDGGGGLKIQIVEDTAKIKTDFSNCKKITHSTQPLNCNCSNRGYKLDTNCAERNHCFGKVQYLPIQEVKELTGEVDVEKDYVLSRLCVHNKRNPDYIPYDEDDELIKPTDCSCDNCFYGRTILSEKILQLNQALEDNKEKKYTEEDMRNAIKMGRDIIAFDQGMIPWYKFKFVDIIQSLQPKTEWKVELIDGQLKLKQ